MCGRFGLKTTFSTLAKLLRAEPVEDHEWGPDYNIAPTDPAPVLLLDEAGAPRLNLFRWGLVPFWADDPKVGARMINARSDTVASKPAFREAFEKRRLVVPASGWYEWRHAVQTKSEDALTLTAAKAPRGKAKTKDEAKPQPYWMYDPNAGPNDGPLMFAGLWAKWKDKATGETRRTFSIITTDAAPSTAQVHDRMPVILTPAARDLWLAPDSDNATLQSLLVPYAGALELHPVAKTVNSVRSDGPELIEPYLGIVKT